MTVVLAAAAGAPGSPRRRPRRRRRPRGVGAVAVRRRRGPGSGSTTSRSGSRCPSIRRPTARSTSRGPRHARATPIVADGRGPRPRRRSPRARRRPDPAPTPTPKPRAGRRRPRSRSPRAVHHQLDHEWCAVAGTQMVLAMHGTGGLSEGLPEGARVADRGVGEPPRQPERRVGTRGDGQAPSRRTACTGYEVRAYDTRQDALRDARPGDPGTSAPGDPAHLARGAHLGHDRATAPTPTRSLFNDARRRAAPTSSTRGTRGCRRSGAPSDPPGDLPGRGRDAPQLPAVGAARGPLPGIATACSSPSCPTQPLAR